MFIWSPFTIGTAFPAEVKVTKKKYTRGDLPNRVVDPQLVGQFQGGLILSLPDEQVEDYLKSVLDLK